MLNPSRMPGYFDTDRYRGSRASPFPAPGSWFLAKKLREDEVEDGETCC